MLSHTDEEIILLYKNGDKEAFKEIVERYTSPLYNFAARIGDKSSAADIVQEVFIKIWKNIGRFDPEKAGFKTWIFTICRNTITDFLRKKRDIKFSDSPSDSFAEDIPDESPMPDEVLQKLQDEKVLNDLLGRLDTKTREILVLHYQEDLTFEEIGKILNSPANTVKSDHRRAILKLRKMIDGQLHQN